MVSHAALAHGTDFSGRLSAAGFNGPFHTLEEGVADYVTKFLMKDDKYR